MKNIVLILTLLLFCFCNKKVTEETTEEKLNYFLIVDEGEMTIAEKQPTWREANINNYVLTFPKKRYIDSSFETKFKFKDEDSLKMVAVRYSWLITDINKLYYHSWFENGWKVHFYSSLGPGLEIMQVESLIESYLIKKLAKYTSRRTYNQVFLDEANLEDSINELKSFCTDGLHKIGLDVCRIRVQE